MSDEERKSQNLSPEGSQGGSESIDHIKTTQKSIFDVTHTITLVPFSADPKPAIEIATENLCTQLNQDNNQFDEKKQDAWLQALDAYAVEYERLIYSVISNHVYNLVIESEEKYVTFQNNLSKVYRRIVNAKDPENDDERIAFRRKKSYATKFYDHVNLAYKQITVLYRSKQEVDNIVAEQLKPALQKATDNFKTRVDDTANNLTSQLVSLVALFTALSFIVFGGISSLDSIFTVLSGKDNTVLPTIIVAIVWALCMMNLLFLFVYFILQIIASKKGTEGENPPEKTTFRGLIQKYPLVFLFNYILLSLLLFTGGAYYAWITGLGRGIYDWVLSVSDLTFILGFALIACIIFFSGRLLYNAINPKEENKQ